MIRRNWRWLALALEQPGETFEPGEIHARRKCSSRRDQEDPEQPEADAHLIPGVAPRCERQMQGRPGCGSLLGFEIRFPGPPCTISVPNLKTDRPAELRRGGSRSQCAAIDVSNADMARGDGRRSARHGLRRSTPSMCRAIADALIDSVRRNIELGRDFFGREMLVDEQQAIELTRAELRHPSHHFRPHVVRTVRSCRRRRIHQHSSPSYSPPYA